MKKFLIAAALLLASVVPGAAQIVCPAFSQQAVLTAGQWQACFDAKQNTLGYTPVNKAGDVMTGRLVTAAPGANTAGLNLSPGTTPAAPVNGDLWVTSSGIFARLNGVTVTLTGGSSGSFAGTSPITVSFPAGVVTYAFDFTVANTFLAQQNNQGATTTSPGWYAQLTGDTTPRVRVGLNGTDVPSIAFGPGNAVRDTFIERVGAGSLRFGAPDAATAVAQTLGVQNVVAGTSNTAGANLTINGSQGTGTGAGGSIIFQVAPAGSTGTAQNALAAALTLGPTKLATFSRSVVIGSPTGGDEGVGTLNATGLFINGAAVSTTAAGLTVGTSTITSGTTTRVLFDNAGVLGEYTISGTGNVAMTASPTFTGTITASLINSTAHVITSAGASALAVGLNGSTNPAFNVDASTASSATGINIKSATAAGGVALSVLSSGTNENLTIDAKGSGTITLGGTSTGSIIHTRATTLSAALTYGGVTLSNAVTGTGNMVLSAGATLTGTTTTASLVATTLNGNTFTTGTYTLTGTAAKTLNFQNTITLAGTDSTTWTGPSANATLAALNIQSQTLSGGVNVTVNALGNMGSAITLNCGLSPLQTATNNAAVTITAPANDGSCIVRITNGATAGAITFSGWTVGSNIGDTYLTTNTNKYDLFVRRIGGVASYQWSALQ